MSTTLILAATAVPAAAAKGGSGKAMHATKVGTTSLSGTSKGVVKHYDLGNEERPEPQSEETDKDAQTRNPIGTSRVDSKFIPRPAPQAIADGTGTLHFNGLNHFDQRTAGTGSFANTQFSLEPPDQGLCVGNGYVLETINTALRVKTTAGVDVTSPVALNQFFLLSPEIVRPSGPFGEFSTDPKCYYDSATSRWFLSLAEIDVDSASGDLANRAHQLLAVSTSSNPTGSWTLYSWDTTNDGLLGTPSHPLCPCFGDQPLIGADANAFFVSTNEYPIHVAGFNGANIYALDKAALAAGAASVNTELFYAPTLAEGQAYSVQPATTPPGEAQVATNGGTEYFLSALEFTGGLDNRIAVWAMTNTSHIDDSPGLLSLQYAVVNSEVYGLPPTMQQKGGSTPLLEFIKAGGFGKIPAEEHLNLLNSNDDRMNQAVYEGGHVWGAVNTRVKGPTGAVRTAIAWFSVSPTWSSTTLTGGSMYAQGYVAAGNNNVAFPSVAVNSSGKAAVGFSLVGADYFPSAAYASIGAGGTGPIKVVRWGAGPADGFTGYLAIDPGDGGVERWGDYSAAVADASGNLWFASETINQVCSSATFFGDQTCGGTRTVYANWGTTISKVTPNW